MAKKKTPPKKTIEAPARSREDIKLEIINIVRQAASFHPDSVTKTIALLEEL